MQVIHFYLVSIFLCCIKSSLAPTVTLSQPTSFVGLGGVKSTQNYDTKKSFLPLNGDPLTKKYSASTSNPLSLKSSDCKGTVISAVQKDYSNPYTSQDYNYDQLLEDTFYDNPGPPDKPPFNLYKATVGVVKTVFNTLKSIQEINPTQTIADVIENSFRISDDVALTVTGSMSLLYFTKISINRLGKAFNCLFDAKHMVKSDEYRENFISKMQSLIDDIEQVRDLNNPLIDESLDQFDSIDLNTVVKNLKAVLFDFKVGNYNYRDMNVEIQLMKGVVLINYTESRILNRLIHSISKEFLKEVEERQYEVDGLFFAKQHSEVLRKSMPSVFSLLLNHLELLKILSTLKVHEENKKIIKFASNLLKKIMSPFINRLKYFGKLTKEELSDLEILEQLIQTLDTGENEPKAVEDKTKESNEMVQKSTSIIDIKLLLPLTKRAIAAVLRLTGKKATENWADHNVFIFKDFLKNQDEEYYMNLLTHNADTAYVLTSKFENSWLDEVDYILAENGGCVDDFFL